MCVCVSSARMLKVGFQKICGEKVRVSIEVKS